MKLRTAMKVVYKTVHLWHTRPQTTTKRAVRRLWKFFGQPERQSRGNSHGPGTINTHGSWPHTFW